MIIINNIVDDANIMLIVLMMIIMIMMAIKIWMVTHPIMTI